MTISARLTVARAVTGGMRSTLRGRTLVAVMAIAFGVALGYAIELINRSAVGELTAGLALLSGDADLDVRGPRAGFDEMLYPALARDRDVAVASPVVEVDVKLRDRDEPLAVLGVDVFRGSGDQSRARRHERRRAAPRRERPRRGQRSGAAASVGGSHRRRAAPRRKRPLGGSAAATAASVGGPHSRGSSRNATQRHAFSECGGCAVGSALPSAIA